MLVPLLMCVLLFALFAGSLVSRTGRRRIDRRRHKQLFGRRYSYNRSMFRSVARFLARSIGPARLWAQPIVDPSPPPVVAPGPPPVVQAAPPPVAPPTPLPVPVRATRPPRRSNNDLVVGLVLLGISHGTGVALAT